MNMHTIDVIPYCKSLLLRLTSAGSRKFHPQGIIHLEDMNRILKTKETMLTTIITLRTIKP